MKRFSYIKWACQLRVDFMDGLSVFQSPSVMNLRRLTGERCRDPTRTTVERPLTDTSLKRHVVKHGLDWISKTWTGLVKHGLVKHGLVKHGFVKHGFVKHGLVKHGLVKHGFVKGGFVKHGFVKGGFVKHGLTRCFSHGSFLCTKRNALHKNRMLSWIISYTRFQKCLITLVIGIVYDKRD